MGGVAIGLVALLGGCDTTLDAPMESGSVSSAEESSTWHLPRPPASGGADVTGAPDATATLDATEPGGASTSDEEPGPETGGPSEPGAASTTEMQPTDPRGDGTRAPVLPGTGAEDGTFQEQVAAAFDGETAHGAEDAATTPLFEGQWRDFLLFREFDCPMRIERIEVHAPADAPFVEDEEFYPDGGTGTLHVVARRANMSNFASIATQPYDAGSPVVFLPDDLENARNYIAYGVAFESDDPFPGTLRVAEVRMFGFCTGPTQEIAWETGPWWCRNVDCVDEVNEGGTAERTVACLRDSDEPAHEALCAGPRPAEDDGACALTCPYRLRFVGHHVRTSADGSAWLSSQTRTDRGTGPLPQAVRSGRTVEAIEGARCSIRTDNPRTMFFANSCTEENSSPTRYCAFRCEDDAAFD
ncbi:MAG: hypothetical protein EA398_15945 [Deltaproteobacteria bacterium]|nr:MAG: hypothetical protein EA398_15945 [Deltaproteobacteria bacterium]